MLSGKAVNGRVVVGVGGRRSGVMWLLLEHPGQILVSVLVAIPFANNFLYMFVCTYTRMYSGQVLIVPYLALNLSACKGNLPVCRYKHAGHFSMSDIPQELQHVTKA
jgi:hypothetical protein